MSSNNININNINKNENMLPKMKLPIVFYPIMLVILILIIFIFLIMYNVNFSITPSTDGSPAPLTKSQNEIVKNVLIVFTFITLALILSISFLPNFKDLKNFFSQISNVLYVVFYTIFLILFYLFTPTNIINDYAKYILPITAFFSAFFFYKGFSTNYIHNFNVNYERIKTIIMFFCLITTIIIFYNINPGGYITQYFGYSLLLTIITSVFALLYLIILLSLSGDTTKTQGSLFEKFSSFSIYGSVGFVIFLIIMTSLIYTYPGGFFTNKTTAAAVIPLLLITLSLWTILLGSNLFPEFFGSSIDVSRMETFKKAMLFLFGLIMSGLIIFWVIYNIQHLSDSYGVTSLILNLIIILIVLGLVYKTFNVDLPYGNSKKNGFFDILINIVTFIPCLFSSAFENTKNFLFNQYKITPLSYFFILIGSILLLILYFVSPVIYNKIYLQNGKQLVNNPVYTDTIYQLGTYEELNGSDQFNYQFALSCWVFIDAVPPNSNPSYEKYTSLLNFGHKPNVLYNGKTNTLMVTMQQKDLKSTTNNKLTDFDNNGNRILYVHDKFLLQKWNNIVINYNGGILDIFLNGELVKSDIGVVPYYTLDNLTIGEENGINGGICNVVYFNKALTSTNIYLLYNAVKNKTPPVINNTNETIVKNKIQNIVTKSNE